MHVLDASINILKRRQEESKRPLAHLPLPAQLHSFLHRVPHEAVLAVPEGGERYRAHQLLVHVEEMRSRHIVGHKPLGPRFPDNPIHICKCALGLDVQRLPLGDHRRRRPPNALLVHRQQVDTRLPVEPLLSRWSLHPLGVHALTLCLKAQRLTSLDHVGLNLIIHLDLSARGVGSWTLELPLIPSHALHAVHLAVLDSSQVQCLVPAHHWHRSGGRLQILPWVKHEGLRPLLSKSNLLVPVAQLVGPVLALALRRPVSRPHHRTPDHAVLPRRQDHHTQRPGNDLLVVLQVVGQRPLDQHGDVCVAVQNMHVMEGGNPLRS
mmetsp:Transcript_18408/g.39670  ORF Transcript_18408/g.39670 Transcript_18408/m.39670 type:complete len:322 (+) Transcript_18408:1717-2682(+)